MRKLLPALLGMLLICSQLLAQNRIISGRVSDERGNALPDVSIQVKGTSTGTISKSDGSFSISVPSDARTLVFSLVGASPKEVEIGSDPQVNVQLNTSSTELTE